MAGGTGGLPDFTGPNSLAAGMGGSAPRDPQLGARGCLAAEVCAHHGVGGMPGPRRKVTLSASEPSIAKKKKELLTVWKPFKYFR